MRFVDHAMRGKVQWFYCLFSTLLVMSTDADVAGTEWQGCFKKQKKKPFANRHMTSSSSGLVCSLFFPRIRYFDKQYSGIFETKVFSLEIFQVPRFSYSTLRSVKSNIIFPVQYCLP
jgi:hypothetical protein